MNGIFDSHAHYDDEAFHEDRETLLAGLPEQGVCCVVNCSADLKGCAASVALAKAYPYFYAAVGVHPEEVKNLPADWLETLEGYLKDKNEKLVAVGEIGLDYHFEDNAPKAEQKAAFAAQLELAAKYDLPVIIHDRDAHGDVLELLQAYKPRGVVHCFSGSVEMMREVVKLGMYVGLGGAVTFKNARVPVQVAAAVPADRLLTETDCPYMAPTPHRGKRCDSSMIALTAAVIAGARGTTAQEILRMGRENACRLFGIPQI